MPIAASVRRASPTEIAEWDALIETNPDGGHMVQSRAFAETKRFDGLEPVHLVIDAPAPGGSTERIHALALEGKVSLGRYWYLPMGPTATDMAPVVEGLRALDIPAFSVQYHPEAAAGPRDANYLFDRFRDLVVATLEDKN